MHHASRTSTHTTILALRLGFGHSTCSNKGPGVKTLPLSTGPSLQVLHLQPASQLDPGCADIYICDLKLLSRHFNFLDDRILGKLSTPRTRLGLAGTVTNPQANPIPCQPRPRLSPSRP